MKKFTINCSFSGTMAPVTVYIGMPELSHHPLHFQSDWLSKSRGGIIPKEVMESLAKLKDLAIKNNVSFEELCTYALEAAQVENQNNKKDTVSNDPAPSAATEVESSSEAVGSEAVGSEAVVAASNESKSELSEAQNVEAAAVTATVLNTNDEASVVEEPSNKDATEQ